MKENKESLIITHNHKALELFKFTDGEVSVELTEYNNTTEFILTKEELKHALKWLTKP